MKKIFDYSEYETSGNELTHIKRRGNKFIKYDYFDNTVRFSNEHKGMVVYVDSTKEDYFMMDFIEQSDKQHGRKPIVISEAGKKEEEEYKNECKAENEAYLELYQKKYYVDFNTRRYHLNPYRENGEFPDILNNFLCGCAVHLRCGDGILDFIYADFENTYEEVSGKAYVAELLKEAGKIHRGESSDDAKSEPRKQKILNKVDEIVEIYHRYVSTIISTKALCNTSLYSAICPPVFLIENEDYTAIREYYHYLTGLQKEYLEMIEFCYDEEFYPEALGDMYPHERFHIYLYLHGKSPIFDRKEMFSPESDFITGDKMPYGLPEDEIEKRMKFFEKKKEAFYKLAEDYNMNPQNVHNIAVLPDFITTQYSAESIEDLLELEFTKMLEMDIRFRKCKRCGKYFLMKGNYDTVYCDRVEEGKTQSCQKLAALENYKLKNANNEAKKVYDKYYKRYHARVNVRQIKEQEFNQWRYKAITMRDDCNDGKISLQEYIDWNEAYFPNRTKKK